MKIGSICFIIFGIVPLFCFSQQPETVLEKVEQNIRDTDLLSYQISYKSINPTVDESIYSISGTTSLKRMPADSIFGARLHIKGKGKKVDYYYDGQNSYEIQHNDKQITIFNPYSYPNTPNNPAKARVALGYLLLPTNQLLIDENFKHTILEENPEITSKKGSNPNNMRITLVYPQNKYGQKLTRTLTVNTSTYFIKVINDIVNWRGVKYKNIINFENFKQNDSDIAENINLDNEYQDYSQKEFALNKNKKENPATNIIGEHAPLFTFTSLFSGEEISLEQFKGQLVLLDFWESWCGYCMLAMPKLNKLQNKYSENTLKIIGVTTGNRKQIQKLIKANNLIYTNIFADKSILQDYRVTNRPTYILINRNGQIAELSFGDLEKIRDRISHLLN